MARIRRVRKRRRAAPNDRVARAAGRGTDKFEPSDSDDAAVLVAAPGACRTIFMSKMGHVDGVKLAAVAEDESQAVERAMREDIDLAVIHIDLGDKLAGLATARAVQKIVPKAGIILLIDSLEGVDLRKQSRWFGMSWSYVLTKRLEDGATVDTVLRSVARGVQWVDPELRRIIEAVWQISAQSRDLEDAVAAQASEDAESLPTPAPTPVQRTEGGRPAEKPSSGAAPEDIGGIKVQSIGVGKGGTSSTGFSVGDSDVA